MKNIIQRMTLGLALIATTTAAKADDLIINGSTTVLPIIQKASETFMKNNPAVTLSIAGGGSGNGIKALSEGLCQIAMSSREMKAGEIDDARAKKVEPYRVSIAHDAIVPVVHPDNPVKALSVEQLQGIYSGKITNWKEVGGKDEKIVLFSRDTSSGTYESWGEMVMKKDKVTRKALLQASCGAVATAVAKNKRAIGYIGFGYLNANLKGVEVDGVEVSVDAVLGKQWPISRELFLYTNGAPQGGVKLFVDFMLDPQKGQKAVVEAGYIPL